MRSTNYAKWQNFLLFQLIWFIATLGRESLEWLLILLLVAHLSICADRKAELRIMVLCAGLGSGADMTLTLMGVFVFSPAPSLLPIPIWLIALWFGFAATLRHSLSYLVTRPTIAILAAGIAAPISYGAGMRLGAVDFGLDTPFTIVLIGGLWTVLMAVFILICRLNVSGGPVAQPSAAS